MTLVSPVRSKGASSHEEICIHGNFVLARVGSRNVLRRCIAFSEKRIAARKISCLQDTRRDTCMFSTREPSMGRAPQHPLPIPNPVSNRASPRRQIPNATSLQYLCLLYCHPPLLPLTPNFHSSSPACYDVAGGICTKKTKPTSSLDTRNFAGLHKDVSQGKEKTGIEHLWGRGSPSKMTTVSETEQMLFLREADPQWGL